MAYRLTVHKAKTTKNGVAFSARHLDRHFDISKAPHIDPSRCHLNRYVEFDVDDAGVLHYQKSRDIQKHEIAVYRKLFQKRLDIMNERYTAQRHPEKCKTLEQYYRSPQSCPDECLIYIGNKDSHPGSDVLKAAASELIKRICKTKHIVPLSLAAHLDEQGAPHLHFRYIFVSYEDKYGPKVSISKGMKEAGISLPDTEKPEHKYNNRQITFFNEIRDTFADICEQEFGLEIERDARDSSRAGRDLATYQREQAMDEVQRLTTQAEALTNECQQLEDEVQKLRAEKSRLQKIASALKGALDRICGKLSRMFSCQEQVLLKEIYDDIERDFSKEEFLEISV